MTSLDDFCPTPSADAYWNESAWFNFAIPEKQIIGMVYFFFRPNMKLLMGGPILWDHTGSLRGDCLFYDWHHIQPIPPGAGKFNFTAHNSLQVAVEEPRKRYRLRYDDCGFKLDLLWTALEEPHHFLGMEIEATGMSAENRMHFEQMGRVTGTVVLHGETLGVDCLSLRDASWGERQIDGVRRGSYFWAVADADTAFHAQTQGEEADQRVVGGFLKLDGKMATLVGGRRYNTRLNHITAQEFDLELEDALGRTATVAIRTCSDLLVDFYPRCQVVWSLLHADFGSGVTGWGDQQEFQPLEQFRRMLRANQGNGK